MIVQDGLRRMYAEQEDVYYYLTTLNENYEHPAMPEGAEEGIIKGMYLLRPARGQGQRQGRGTARPAAGLRRHPARGDRRRRPAARRLGRRLRTSGACPASPSSPASAVDAERWNLLHPTGTPRQSWVEQCLGGRRGAGGGGDRLHAEFADQIRPYVPARYRVLGTDGFGRSDYRKKLRHFFEVDRHWVTLAALESLAMDGAVPAARVAEAIEKYGIDPDKPNPAKV